MQHLIDFSKTLGAEHMLFFLAISGFAVVGIALQTVLLALKLLGPRGRR